MNRVQSTIVIAAAALLLPGFAGNTSGVINVKELGALGDGKSPDTPILQRAIDSCSSAGGEVVFPPGAYLTGSLDLRSNVTLRLQRGAIILGSRNLADYKEHRPRLRSYNDVFLRYSLFYAERASNIVITGEGTIDGQGQWFKVEGKERPARYMNRPFVIRCVECTNVRVENVRLQNSAMWMQQYLACDDLVIRGITVFNHANKNNDMIDIDGCRNVIVSGCFGDTDDDGITLKSTSERVTENVAITNCVLSSHCNAIKTGTESTGGFRNITIANMVVKPSAVDSVRFGRREGISGITLSVVDGGSLDGMTVSGVVMDGPEVPIFLRLGNRARPYDDRAPKPGVGSLRNVLISDIIATNAKSAGCSITGVPGHPVENVTLSGVRIEFAGGVTEPRTSMPEEKEEAYPEATLWGRLPAYAFFVRHASNIRFRDCTFTVAREDVRPVFLCDDVSGLSLSGVTGAGGPRTGAAIVLSAVRLGEIRRFSVIGGAGSLVNLVGAGSSDAWVADCDLRDVRAAVSPAGRSVEVHLSGNLQGRSGQR